MKFISTRNITEPVSFRDAIINGIAGDGGLYLPDHIPSLPVSFINNLSDYSYKEISFEIASKFIESEISKNDLTAIIEEAVNFPAPLKRISGNEFILELFHGPTLAFKDFGARFMAKVLAHFIKDSSNKLFILVATSGDTGSAVANGFWRTPGIDVIVLYPRDKVSPIQEKQFTTLGNNITAIEVGGTFDDCQKIVKRAFADKDITRIKKISSANSINIARLIPQIFYYFEAVKQLEDPKRNLIISVPSGNLGNLTAGLIARQMGLPAGKFVSAVNANDIFAQYLESGNFNPRKSVNTLSNAMDVGNPSNFERISFLFKKDTDRMRDIIYSRGFSDLQTLEAIKKIYAETNYIMDPHTAVGYLALESFARLNDISNSNSIVLSTAHPAKFAEVVEKALNINIEIPEKLQTCITKGKKSIQMSSNFDDFKEYMLNTA